MGIVDAASRPPRDVKSCRYVFDGDKVPRRVQEPPRRPRSARHIASLGWSWGPAHSRYDHLYLSLDTARRHWLLWFEWSDDGYAESRVRAFAPREHYPDAKDAAAALVEQYYVGEMDEFQSPEGRWGDCRPGLLEREDLDRIATRLWPASGGSSTSRNTAVRDE